jgi:hypothetical protein
MGWVLLVGIFLLLCRGGGLKRRLRLGLRCFQQSMVRCEGGDACITKYLSELWTGLLVPREVVDGDANNGGNVNCGRSFFSLARSLAGTPTTAGMCR